MGMTGRLGMAALTAVLLAGAPRLASAQDVKQGEQVYNAQKCQVCHSIAGKGNVKGPLDEVGSKLPADDIRAWLLDAKTMTVKTEAPRKPAMKSYTLTKDEADALVTYLSAMTKKSTTPRSK